MMDYLAQWQIALEMFKGWMRETFGTSVATGFPTQKPSVLCPEVSGSYQK